MNERVTGRIYTRIRFEAVIREKKTGDIGMKDIFVEYPSSVIYEVAGEEKVGAYMEMTDQELWNAATANTQPDMCYGETGELLALRKKETTIEKRMKRDTQPSIFDAAADEDKLNAELRNEAAERYDNMIR